jgi:hypothetical protein
MALIRQQLAALGPLSSRGTHEMIDVQCRNYQKLSRFAGVSEAGACRRNPEP